MDAEFVVVGAGVAGSSAAWRLAEAGREVTLLEQFPLGHERGSSHGFNRIFRFAYPDPLYVRMAQQALPLWGELGEDLLVKTGGIDLGAETDLDAIEGALRACGAQAEKIDARERARRWPWLEAGDRPALYSPDTGVIAAAATLRRLADRAREAGALLLESTPALALHPDNDGVRIDTPAGSVHARKVIVAAGAWTAPLLQPLGIRLPLRVTREQVLYFAADVPLIPFIDRGERFRYAVPQQGGAPGIKVAEHEAGVTTTAAARGFDLDVQGVERVRAYVRKVLPGVGADPIDSDTCLYTLTPSEDFLIDVVGPLVIASPCSGHGFKFAPLIGEILSALATDRVPPVPLDRFTVRAHA